MPLHAFDAHVPSNYDAVADFNTDQLMRGDPACAPRVTRRASSMIPAAVVIAISLATAAVFARYPAAWQNVVQVIAALRDQHPPAPMTPTVQAPPVARDAPSVEARDIAAVPGGDAGTALPPPQPLAPTEEAAAEPSAPEQPATVSTQIEPLTPPKADPRDPNQKRALAAGLHPDISRAVLSRLTTGDYRNAAVAVRTALSTTPDDEVLTYPRDASAKGALFEVRFVEGAGPQCRRYVVTVTLDRWSTTALPIEKCGAGLPKRTAGRKAAG